MLRKTRRAHFDRAFLFRKNIAAMRCWRDLRSSDKRQALTPVSAARPSRRVVKGLSASGSQGRLDMTRNQAALRVPLLHSPSQYPNEANNLFACSAFAFGSQDISVRLVKRLANFNRSAGLFSRL